MKNRNDAKPKKISSKDCVLPEAANIKHVSGFDAAQHWDKTFQRDVEKLGWYEAAPVVSLKMITDCALTPEARIFIAGAGACTMVDALLEKGYQNIIANDISEVALNKLKNRLAARAKRVQWLVDDLTRPTSLGNLEAIDLWYDRAVLHFFNEEAQQNAYFSLLRKILKPGGSVIIAAFNLNGAQKCSGLPVFRYNADMLAERLGSEFELLDNLDKTHIMPSGAERPYVYARFVRKNTILS